MFLFMVFALIIAVVIAVLPGAQCIRIKLAAYAHGMQFMVRANDLPKQFTGSNYMRMQVPPTAGGKRVIRVVFIRHGQSVWNSLFNSYDVSLPIRFTKAVINEFIYLFQDPFSSVIIDSPLSSTGRKDADALAQFMRSANGKVSFDTNVSVIVCSNLRRAMETAAIGLGPRISMTREKIIVDSALQEGSRNIDAQTLSTEKGKITACKIGPFNTPDLLSTVFDPCLNAGNRTSAVNVYGRMDEFVKQLFGDAASGQLCPASPQARRNVDLKEIIVVGHSGYFMRFFRRFLPSTSSHVAKKKKMKNCSVVAFDLTRIESTNEIIIDESSIAVLYKGF